jgi:hypothetical protein
MGRASDPRMRNARQRNRVVMSPPTAPVLEPDSWPLLRSAAASTMSMVMTSWERIVAMIRSTRRLIQWAVPPQ